MEHLGAPLKKAVILFQCVGVFPILLSLWDVAVPPQSCWILWVILDKSDGGAEVSSPVRCVIRESGSREKPWYTHPEWSWNFPGHKAGLPELYCTCREAPQLSIKTRNFGILLFQPGLHDALWPVLLSLPYFEKGKVISDLKMHIFLKLMELYWKKSEIEIT